jgi:hypothetical protein
MKTKIEAQRWNLTAKPSITTQRLQLLLGVQVAPDGPVVCRYLFTSILTSESKVINP